jgi:hypothetical protein
MKESCHLSAFLSNPFIRVSQTFFRRAHPHTHRTHRHLRTLHHWQVITILNLIRELSGDPRSKFLPPHLIAIRSFLNNQTTSLAINGSSSFNKRKTPAPFGTGVFLSYCLVFFDLHHRRETEKRTRRFVV